MRHTRYLAGILICAGLALGSAVLAQSTRSTPAIEQLLEQSVSAINSGNLEQATRYLTRLTSLPEHVHSEQAQELLGNVREQRGQLAHAVEEYRIYLQKYPNSSGVARVQRRLNAILQGGVNRTPAPSSVPAETGDALADAEADIQNQNAAAASGQQAAAQTPRRTSTPRRPRPAAQPAEPERDPTEWVVTDRGRVALTYRYNESQSEIEDLDPEPGELAEEEFFFDNTVSTSLYYERQIENNAHLVELTFSGSIDLDLDGDRNDRYRLYEATVYYQDKATGRNLTFGRLRLKPSGIAYRLDGLMYRMPLDNGPELGFFVGGIVNSTQDAPFEDGRFLVGVSATYEDLIAENTKLTLYLVEQREGSNTDRRAFGVEAQATRDWGGIFVNAEYDIYFNTLNRILITGTRAFPNRSRITGRINHYRSPLLTRQNALIGQSVRTIDELALAFTQDEIDQLAIDRSSKVTTAGLNYYGPINDTWDLSLDGTLYYTSGRPASGGVPEVEADGMRGYFGARLIGSGVFAERDRLDFGVRYSYSDDFDQYVFDSSVRFNVTEDLSVRPRIQVGYRDNTSEAGHQRFVLPSINARYRINRETLFQVEAGGRWTWEETSVSEINFRQYLVTAGFVRSF